MGTWEHVSIETWKRGNRETYKHGSVGAWDVRVGGENGGMGSY